MPLKVHDDHKNDVTSSSVFIARSLSEGVYVDQSTEYISDNHIEVHAEVSENQTLHGTIQLETIDPRVVQTKLNVTVLPCPPGMVRQGEKNATYCACRGSYDGQIICNTSTFEAKLQRGSWIGHYTYNNNTEIVASSCPYCSSFSEHRYFNLPQRSTELESHLCNKIHRTGTLCGQCSEGYGPSLYGFDCMRCDDEAAAHMWVFYILAEYVPLTIFFILVIIFDIRATSAPANAFVFFAQVIPTAFVLNGSGVILLHKIDTFLPLVYTLPYDIWNMQFFGPFQDQIFLSSKLSTLQVISINYLAAVYPLFLICVVYFLVWLYEHSYRPIVCLCRPLHWLLARFQRVWNIQRSLIHTFATFVLLSYTRFTLVSFYLLTRTPLTTDGGGTFGPPYGVVYYDGTIHYLGREHAPYVLLSLFVLTTFVAIPPILLSLPSILRNFRTVLNSRPLGVRLILRLDVLCSSCKCLTANWPKLQQFLSAFHGCYKNGTEGTEEDRQVAGKFDYRWFAGFYFVLRVVIFAIYAFTVDWFIQYTALQFVCIVAGLFFLLLRPYKTDFYNKLDASMFSLLVAINSLTMYNYYVTVMGDTPSTFTFSLQYVLLLLPIIYISVFVVVYMYRKCCKGRVYFAPADTVGERDALVAGGGGETTQAQNTPQDYLTFMEQTGRLHDVNQYRPSSASASSVISDENLSPISTDNSSDMKTTTATGHSTNRDTSASVYSSGASNERVTLPGASNDIHTPDEPLAVSRSRYRHTVGYGSMQERYSQTRAKRGRGGQGRVSRARNTSAGERSSKCSVSKEKQTPQNS